MDGGVDRFEDLVAYAALYRPGPLNEKMHTRYVERKRGREKFSLHPLLQPVLSKTYGVMVYQEQIMKILHIVGNIPLKDCEIVRKAISKKKIELFIKYKEMFIVNGQKNLECTEQEITNLWDQVQAFSEYGFNLSHACAYTYVTMWLLCLKAHYPHEFYTSILSCETLTDKIKEYKMESKIHSVEMERIDINKSNVNFDLQGDKIYYGFSNIKGIGEEPAKRIVAHQPYSSFEDFLNKFGTDSSVLKPLLGLRCFKDADPVTLWKFAESYKDSFKKIEDKKKRFHISMKKYESKFKDLFPSEQYALSELSENFNESYWSKYDIDEEREVDKDVVCKDEDGTPRIVIKKIKDENGVLVEKEITEYFKTIKVKKIFNRLHELKKLLEKRNSSLEKFAGIEKATLPKLSEFNSRRKIDAKLRKEFSDEVACEEKYYGFAWIHDLERSPDYRGNFTFDNLKSNRDSICPVELKIVKVIKNTSKKGTVYHQLLCEDATGQQNKINVWQDDFEMWGSEFVAGNLFRMRLQAPSGGFATFTIENNYVGKWRNKKRYNSRKEDIRIFAMRKAEVVNDIQFMSDEEVLSQFDECVN